MLPSIHDDASEVRYWRGFLESISIFLFHQSSRFLHYIFFPHHPQLEVPSHAMSSSHVLEHGKSFYHSGDAYEMKSRGGKSTGETIVVEENESKYKGATANDRHDMDRVGKTQELTVRPSATLSHSWSTTNPLLEKLQLPLDLRVFAAAGQRMGPCDYWNALSPLQWRNGRCDLDVPGRHRRHDFQHAIHSRDGKHCTYSV